MDLVITPAQLCGTIVPPPSKSQAHRALIAAYLAGSVERLENLAQSQDILATRRCMEALLSPEETLPWLDGAESGSTLRFLSPLALALRGGGVFTGRGRLMERPQRPYFDLFEGKGIAYGLEDGTLTVEGRLPPGRYVLPGNVSSQFVTGLLYALPLVEGDSEIVLTSPLESRGYVDMTLDVLERFGVTAREVEDGFAIPGGQRYKPCAVTVEADWSQGAFWIAAKRLGHPVETLGLDEHSTQGDRVIREFSAAMDRPGELELDVSGCPDLAPPLAAMAALRAGQVTRLVKAARLRLKESDRLTAIAQTLGALGADVREDADSLTVWGKGRLSGGAAVDGCNDHRIAMMAAVAATRCQRRVVLTGAECVEKSYPDFWEDYAALGGEIWQLERGEEPLCGI